MITSGRSMLPTLPAAPTPIVVEKIPFTALRKGDVVVYDNAKQGRTCHRIFRKMSATEWWAKGDHNHFPDVDYVTPQNLVGRVVINEGVISLVRPPGAALDPTAAVIQSIR